MSDTLSLLVESEASPNRGGRPHRRMARKDRQPSDAASPIVWSVWLGANTARRLAEEWGISIKNAGLRLNQAVEAHKLRRLPYGRYGLACLRFRDNGRFSGGAVVGDGVPWKGAVSCGGVRPKDSI